MSITGAADGPPFPPRRRHRRHRLRDVRRAGHRAGALRARAHRTRTGSRHRDAGLGRRAAHLSGRHLLRDRRRCRRGWATATRPSCRTRRSPRRTASSCSRSATTISGGGSARSPGLPEDAAVRDQPPARHRLRPAAAVPRRPASDRAAAALDRSADRGRRAVRLGSRSSRSCSSDPQLAAREMIARVEHATIGPLGRSACRSSSPTRRARSERRRRRSASTPTRCSNRISDSAPTRSPQLRRQQIRCI